MRKLFVTAIVLGLFAVTPAAFAQGDQNKDNKSDQGAKSDQGGKSNQGGKSHQGRNSSHQGDNAGQRGSSDNAQNQHQTRTHNAATNHSTRNAITATRTSNAHKAGSTRNATANNRMRNADTSRTFGTISAHHSDRVLALRENVQASHHFHAAAYRPPHGYVSRHWGYGENLPEAYFDRDYWITDFAMYSLFTPPDGLVWVRVGDDALLIDDETGEIIQVDYGVFA